MQIRHKFSNCQTEKSSFPLQTHLEGTMNAVEHTFCKTSVFFMSSSKVLNHLEIHCWSYLDVFWQ